MSTNTCEVNHSEKEKLLPTPQTSESFLSRSYARLQDATRGYLWLVLASLVLIVGAGILLFPQKMWNRLMLELFGCVTLSVRGKQYNFCERAQPENVAPLF